MILLLSMTREKKGVTLGVELIDPTFIFEMRILTPWNLNPNPNLKIFSVLVALIQLLYSHYP